MISSVFSFALLISMDPTEERSQGVGKLEAQDASPELWTNVSKYFSALKLRVF